MKKQFKSPIKSFAPVFLMLAAMFVIGFGCNIFKPMPDPLAGFHAGDFRTLDANKAITDDYKNYIQKLSPEEKKYLGPSPIDFFEDGKGQHAVRITIALNGTWWEHILFYDKNDRRIRVIKYSPGKYRS
ncbi:MAG: hypothetical protein WAO02_10550 [Verrucomicrobiia bacterium]